jgi:predicted ATP-grasp superfamily ATP-dependent carboligase
MVECKRELSTGVLNIMEVNGRFWGSLQLALDAGVDFPTLLVECALGEGKNCHPAPYRNGVRTRWEWGEVDYVYLQAKRARAAGSSGIRAALRSATEVLRWSRKDRAEIFRLSDPLPFLGETVRRLGLLR